MTQPTSSKSLPRNPRQAAIRCLTALTSTLLVLTMTNTAIASHSGIDLDKYDVAWTSPSADSRGSMPLGNGEVGINAWVEPSGDLRFLISRNDSYSEVSRLLKVGAVRVSLSPSPFVAGQPFSQRLHLKDGAIEITGGKPGRSGRLTLFVDADHPVIHCAGRFDVPTRVTVTAESWRTEPRTLSAHEKEAAWTMNGAPYPLVESADVFPVTPSSAVIWYHRNETSCVPATLDLQGLAPAAGKAHDPLLHRTFGGMIEGDRLAPSGAHSLANTEPARTFSFRIACPCAETKTAAAWIALATRASAASPNARAAARRSSAWWHRYWDSAWMEVTGETPLTSRPGTAIPGAEHPLRVGYDSGGGNKFPGEIAHTQVFDHPLTQEEIERLARTPRQANSPAQAPLPNPSPEERGKMQTVVPGETPSSHFDFSHGMTLTAWIKPDTLTPGRIFDKITAGQHDGFLFDTHPGDTLRLIVGDREMSAKPGTLKAGVWQFVAAVVDPTSNAMIVSLDGVVVVKQGGRSGAEGITRGYLLQRYMQACGGRGPFPIKFNGGQFTVSPDGDMNDSDWRRWGDSHWWQNARLMYHPMPAQDDSAMMDPLFQMYEDAVPLAEERSRLIEHVGGAYFPETMTVWGTYANSDFGWDRTGRKVGEVASPWWAKTRNQGPELVALMLDRWEYTQDREYLQKRVLPMAVSVLTYFDQRYKRDDAGKIVLDPTQAVETFWSGVVDDTPTVAGLVNVSQRLTALPKSLTTPEQQALFARIAAACPTVPTETHKGKDGNVTVIAPARKYDPHRSNVENPETYAIWPFRLYGIGKPDLQLARDTYAARVNHLPVGWGYDGNVAAVLGLSDEAAGILQQKCDNSNSDYRWPATWGPNFDWLPDQNHGGNLLETAQLMLLQSDGKKILLFPAWPRVWDVRFKLHAAHNTTVEATLKDGKVTDLVVTPGARRKDVVVCLDVK